VSWNDELEFELSNVLGNADVFVWGFYTVCRVN
jgi:hypothetical protein